MQIRLGIFFFFLLFACINTAMADPIATRTITFVNNCHFPVWFGFAGGSTNSKNASPDKPTLCTSDSDCFTGSSCIQTGSFKQCFWNNPQPANNNYQLAANGGSNTVNIPVYNNPTNAVWSGAVAGRTGCTNANCETATCSRTADGACDPSRGFDQPATQAEFTFNNQQGSSDYYDIEVINGINIPVQMSPDTTVTDPQNPYFCGSPGSTAKQGLLGQCSWTFTPPSNDYQWVKSGGISCHANSDCHGTDTCGLSFNPGKSPLLQKTCGKLIGYWTADQVCGYNPTQGAPFNCTQPLSPPQQGLNLNNLYGCTGVGSCYQNHASASCCGCANWDQLGVTVPAAPYTTQCVNTNPAWQTYVQPQLLWIKQACPTAYTYPYDDMSSTFTCRTVKNNMNSVNYTITFCPNNNTAKPAT